MPKFENNITKAINKQFDGKGIAYRRKQAKYTSQVFDILVDNPYLAIECKSINYKKTKKLYFSQHFSENQIERESEFLDKSGRDGFLAIELRRGRGKSRQYVVLSWSEVKAIKETKKGINFKGRIKKDNLKDFANYIFKNCKKNLEGERMREVRKFGLQLVKCRDCGENSGLDYGKEKCPVCGSENIEVIGKNKEAKE